MRRMRQIGVTGLRVLERHHKAMGKSIGQPFWTDVGSPFERGNAVDLCGQRLKASNDFLNLLLGHLRLDFEEDDMPGQTMTNSILTRGGAKTAWFKDTEGNILAVSQRL